MKKVYVKPQVEVLGEVADLTLGEGWIGNADSVWTFSWGTNPSG